MTRYADDKKIGELKVWFSRATGTTFLKHTRSKIHFLSTLPGESAKEFYIWRIGDYYDLHRITGERLAGKLSREHLDTVFGELLPPFWKYDKQIGKAVHDWW